MHRSGFLTTLRVQLQPVDDLLQEQSSLRAGAHDAFARTMESLRGHDHSPVAANWYGAEGGIAAKLAVRFGFGDRAAGSNATSQSQLGAFDAKLDAEEIDHFPTLQTLEDINGGPLPEPEASAAGPRPGVVETVDAAADTSTAYTLIVGQTAQGTINANGDRDYYAVTLQAGQTYSFAMTGTGVNNVVDPYLRLMDSSGFAELAFNDDGLPGNNSVFTYTPTTTGTYYIAAGSFDDVGTGQYGIAVTAGARPSFDIPMGAGVVDADRTWAAAPGAGVVVTYAFRASPATYTVSGSNISTFTQLTATEMAAVRAALQAWSDVSGITFVEVNPGGYSDSATMLFANYTDNDGAGAFAFFPGSTASTASAGDVWLNTNSIPTGSAINPGSYAFNAIVHEIGHAIGLSHPGLYNAGVGQVITYANNAQFIEDTNQYSVMSYFDESNTGSQFFGYPESPLLFDIYAAQQVYGANTATRAGDTTYGFNSNAGGIYDFTTNPVAAFTIWDGGGIDTIDASGFSNNQTIDLNEGKFSTIGSAISNIAIALGVTIENAVGGSGNDTIIGNGASNLLRIDVGGNDAVQAGDGDDTIVGGAALTAADTIDGGIGSDTLSLDGNYAAGLVFGATTMTNVENLSLAAGSSYNLTLNDANVSAGQTLNVVGSALLTGQTLTFNGSAETNGAFNIQGGSGNDDLFGGTGNDTYAGNNGNDIFRLYRGGVDSASGSDGNDSFLMGSTLTAADSIDGGTGTDTLNLDGNYAANLTFGATTMTNVENLYLSAGNSYNLTLNDANVSAGQTLNVVGSALLAGQNLTFNGSAETNGAFNIQGGAGNDDLFGGTGNDTYTGNNGNDLFRLYRGGVDNASGGDGNDSFLMGGTLTATDTINGGNGTDTLNLDGNYATNLTFGATTMTNVENLYLSAGNSYNLTLNDTNVGAGQTLNVVGSALLAGQNLTFNGSAEANGAFNIQGGAGNDDLFGGTGNDTYTGNNGNDLFRLYRGGVDNASGGDGNDSFLMGGTLTAADTVNGGIGTDTANLDGNYAAGLTFGAATMTNVENLYLSAGNSYNLTLNDANVGASQTLTVLGGALLAGQNLTFNGSAETNGAFNIQGGAGADSFQGGAGSDTITGGNGNDTFIFADNSGVDSISDFDDFGDDVIQLSVTGITGFAQVQAVMTQQGNDVLIDFATTDIILVNTTLASIGADDFTFA